MSIDASTQTPRQKIKWFWLIYTVLVAMLMIYGLVGDIVKVASNNYTIFIIVWNVLIGAVILFGNFTYALNRVTPAIRKAWRFVPLLLIVDLVETIATSFLDDHSAKESPVLFYLALAIMLAIFNFPILLIHYRIGYGKPEAQPGTDANGWPNTIPASLTEDEEKELSSVARNRRIRYELAHFPKTTSKPLHCEHCDYSGKMGIVSSKLTPVALILVVVAAIVMVASLAAHGTNRTFFAGGGMVVLIRALQVFFKNRRFVLGCPSCKQEIESRSA